ncbi:MAG: RNA methyltransferase [Hyphomicrobiales bacterium]|nr:MAG: RNA methyltransferase [Hyphomicrobiales bacterium]
MISTLKIERLGHEGDGIGFNEAGNQVFVPYALPGETVRVYEHQNRGELIEIVEKSPDRVDPKCQHFTDCGGCNMQHLSEPAYLSWKTSLIVDALSKQGIDDVDMLPIVSVLPGSRRRAAFSFKAAKDGVHLGFHGKKSSQIITPKECPVLDPVLEKHLVSKRGFSALARQVVRAKKEERMTATLGINGVSIDMTGRDPGKNRNQVEEFWNATSPFWKVMLNDELVSHDPGDDLVKSGDFNLATVPGAFLQAVSSAEAALVEHSISFLKGSKNCADLFSGIGTFSFPMARFAKVTAIESQQAALNALKQTASRTQKIKAIATIRRDLFKHPLSELELRKFDAILFDPPRAGARAQCEQIAKSKIRKVAAVSCNPISFARDAKTLIDGGFKLISLLPVDQFLWSNHVEMSAHFER